MHTPGIVNAYIRENRLISVVRAEDGSVSHEGTQAPYTVFYKTADVGPRIRRMAEITDRISRVTETGTHLRFDFRSHDMRSYFLQTQNNPFFKLQSYEGDVHPIRRWIVDAGVKFVRPRVAYLDLETDSRVPFSKKEEATILSWAIVDGESAEDVAYSGVLSEFNTEAEATMLADMFKALEGFDLICAWNGDGFDFPVIRAANERTGLNANMDRWLWLDHLELYKRLNTASESGEEKTSMRLNDVAAQITGETKDEFDASKTYESWAMGGDERDRLVKYNIQDTMLLRRIEQKTGFISLFFTLAQVTDVLPDTRGLNPISQMDGYMLRMGHAVDYRFKTRVRRDKMDKYEGAYVMPPETNGIERNVHVADFASLYPSIILTWNISPETLAGDDELDGTCIAPGTKQRFRTNIEGILPKALGEMISLRKKWNDNKASLPPGTEAWKDADRKSTAYKVAANSFYGVLGSPFSRYFDVRMAESITTSGVWLLKETIQAAKVEGMRVVYGDSITGDRTVVLKDDKCRLQILPVKELFDMGKRVESERGKDFVTLDGWTALARKGGVDGFYPLDFVIRHAAGKKIHTLSSKRGHTSVTSDHGIIVGERTVTPQQFVDEGLQFDCVKAQPGRNIASIDLFEFVKDWVSAYPYKGREIARRPRATDAEIYIDGWGAPKQFIRRHYDLGTPEADALLRVIGAYIAEGSSNIRGLTTTRFGFSIAQNDKRWLERIKSDLDLITRDTATSIMATGGGCHALRSGAALLSIIFAALCGVKSHGRKLPSFFFDLPKRDADLVFALMCEGDGSIDASGATMYTSNSPVLTAGISYYLSQHDVQHAIHHRADKNAWSIRTRSGPERVRSKLIHSVRDPNGGEYVYDLSVNGAQSFVDGIGRVLLHNTDSFFASGPNEEGFGRFVDWCNSSLYPKLLDELGCTGKRPIKLAYEKEFERIVMVGAKKYIGQFAHYKGARAVAGSKPEIKGLEYKRRDTNRMARTMQTEVIDLIVRGEERAEPYEAIVEKHLRHVLNDELTLGEVSLSKAISKGLDEYTNRTKKDGTEFADLVHVAVAKIMLARGEEVREGTRISYVVTDKGPPLKAIPASDYTGTELDRYYLWESLVYPPTLRLLQSAFPHNASFASYEKQRPKKERVAKSKAITGSVSVAKKRKVGAKNVLPIPELQVTEDAQA